MQTISLSKDTQLAGSRKNFTENTFNIVATTDALVRSDYGTVNTTVSGSKTSQKFTIDKNKNIVNVSNCSTLTQKVQTFTSPLPLAIFACNSSDDGVVLNIGGMRVYSFKLYDNGTLIRDFIPCIKPSGEYGLYDVVNNQFYGNAGTGSFTGG